MIQPFKVPASVRSLLQEQRGTIAVSAGLAIFVITGFAGLGVDLGYWESVTRNLQGTSDMAAYSAAIAASRSGRSAGITTAYAIGANTGFVDQQSGVSITVNNPPTRGRYAGNQNGWEVIISQPQKLFFSAAFLSSPPTAAGRAVAHAQANGTPYCILALNPSASQAVYVQDSAATANLSNCSMQVNSTSNAAFAVNGGIFSADTLSVTGNKSVSTNSTFTVGKLDAPGAQPILDPYSNLQVPSYSCSGSPTQNVAVGTVPAGTYCHGMTFNGNSGQVYTLSGTYILAGNNSDFVVQAGATVNTGVGGATIILTNGAAVKINGGTTNMTGSTSGTYAGFVFFQDRNDTAAASLVGGSSQSLTGTLYFPSAAVAYNGNSATSACTQIVADTIKFQGSSTTRSACTGIVQKEITGYVTALAE